MNTDDAVSQRKIAGAIRSLVNARDLELEHVRVLHEGLLMPFLLYGSEIMIWREKERSRIGAVQMDNLRGWLGFRGMDRIPNAWIKSVMWSSEGG